MKREAKTVAKLLQDKVNEIALQQEYQNSHTKKKKKHESAETSSNSKIATPLTFSGVTLLFSKYIMCGDTFCIRKHNACVAPARNVLSQFPW